MGKLTVKANKVKAGNHSYTKLTSNYKPRREESANEGYWKLRDQQLKIILYNIQAAINKQNLMGTTNKESTIDKHAKEKAVQT